MKSQRCIIQWEAWNDYEGLTKFTSTRKNNLKHTSILWLCCGIAFNEDGDIRYLESPILIWLN